MVLRRRSLLRASTPLPTLRHKGGGSTKSLRAALDAGLNDHAYIVPGLGDAGDRMFGSLTSVPAAVRVHNA